jgi:hypothetical protein
MLPVTWLLEGWEVVSDASSADLINYSWLLVARGGRWLMPGEYDTRRGFSSSFRSASLQNETRIWTETDGFERITSTRNTSVLFPSVSALIRARRDTARPAPMRGAWRTWRA